MVDIMPAQTGEWWVNAETGAGSRVVVEVWRDDAGVFVLESSSKLRAAGDESTRTVLMAGLAYTASFTPVGKPGVSILREHFTPRPGEFLWIRQFGTSEWDDAAAVAADPSGVYVAGYTYGTFPGQVSAGGIDAFLRKYDASGAELWTRQFGTSGIEGGNAVAADASGVYVAGYTAGMFPGQASAGSTDAFLRKYDVSGAELWTRQFGTSESDAAWAVAADPSGVYVAGNTYGALSGQAWAGSFDAFLRKYDASGAELWTRQFGTSESDGAGAIAADSSGVYVAGIDNIGEGQGYPYSGDAFLREYDASGAELWNRQFGTSEGDVASALAVDASGVYASGITAGTFPGQASAGSTDAFLVKVVP